MKAILRIIPLVLIVFSGKSQKKEFIIENIFPTETSTAIHAHFMFPFKMNFKIEKKQFRGNYRPTYIYHFIPRVKMYKKNEIQMYIDYVGHSDSSIVRMYISDGYIRVNEEDNLFYDEEYLITFKSGVFARQQYNLVLQVKHNQKKENFDINKLSWFVDIAQSWTLTYGRHH